MLLCLCLYTLTLFTFLWTTVVPMMELKPNAGSDRAWVWNTLADYADECPKPELLAIRFLNAESECLLIKYSITVEKCPNQCLIWIIWFSHYSDKSAARGPFTATNPSSFFLTVCFFPHLSMQHDLSSLIGHYKWCVYPNALFCSQMLRSSKWSLMSARRRSENLKMAQREQVHKAHETFS